MPGTVLIAEDDWLNALFADELVSLPDYVRCSSKLRRIMAAHVAAVLNAGASVVLDFPANTVDQRGWMRGILEKTTAAHQLHLLDVPDKVCLTRLRMRNSQGDHPFAVTEARFRQFANHYAPPTPDGGFNVARHDEGG
ncbi:ATP-binding protein [Halovulum dunhuangense]|uniref:ATP-binding protein n=1 Tax=Halovulum dunhuangense TaxID=1505036 RepID=A0A849L7L2_9RHOB|nr:ATP-binding protein [Halovulum dunhuangense]NNU82124.1 ATP-binding protein [Halovulum dunhuangense]